MILNSAHVNMQFELDQSNCNETLTILMYTADSNAGFTSQHMYMHYALLHCMQLNSLLQLAGEFTAVNHIGRDILYGRNIIIKAWMSSV